MNSLGNLPFPSETEACCLSQLCRKPRVLGWELENTVDRSQWLVERKENMFLLLRVVSVSKGFCDDHAELAIWAKESENDKE